MRKFLFFKFLLPISFILLLGGGVKAQNVYLNEDFSSGLLPEGWSDEKEVSSSASWSFIDGTVVFDGGNKLGSSAALITNAVDLSNSITPTLSFSYSSPHARGYVDSLVVFYCVDSNENWIPLFSNNDIQSELTNVEISLTSVHEVEAFQLRFEAYYAYGANVVIDDVMITNSIACNVSPTGFRNTSLTDSSATFVWVPGGYADSARVIIATEEIVDFTSYDASVIVSEEWYLNTPVVSYATISVLSPSTYYYAYLQLSCGSGDVSPFVSLNFTTPCVPTIITDSYTQGFEDNSDCWMLLSNTSTLPTVTNSYSYEGDYSLAFHTQETEYIYAIFPIGEGLTDVEISINLYAPQEASSIYDSELQIGLLDDPADLTSIVELKTIIPNSTKTWENWLMAFNKDLSSSKYLILYSGAAEKENEIYVDNITISKAQNCYAPIFVVYDNITAFTVDLDWYEVGTSQSWYVKASTTELTEDELNDLDESQLVKATSLPFCLEGLSAFTQYYVYVRAECGDWCTETVTFTTRPTSALGYYEEFDYTSIADAGIYYGNLVDADANGKWVNYPYNTKLEYPAIATNYNNSESAGYSIQLYASSDESYRNISYVIFPQFEEEVDMTQVQVEFAAYATTTAEKLIVSLCEGNDFTTAFPIDTIQLVASTWTDIIVSLEDYSGVGRSVALSTQLGEIVSTDVSFYIDDVSFDRLIACNPITALMVTDIEPTTAKLSWNSPGASASSSWTINLYTTEVSDHTAATPAFTFSSDSESISLTGLDSYTDYYAYVRLNSPDCTDAEYSLPISFSTPSYIKVPYFNDFTGETTSSAPSMWTCYNPNSTTASESPQVYSAYSYYFWSTNLLSDISDPALRFFAPITAPENYAVMPYLDADVDISNLMIQFYAIGYSSYLFDMHVGIMDDPDDVSTFTPIDTVSLLTSGTFYTQKISTSNYTGNGRYIAFKAAGNGATAIHMYIDNILIYEATDCKSVSDITVTTTSLTSLDVKWTTEGTETEWDVKIISTPVTLSDVDDVASEYVISSTIANSNSISLTNLDISSNTDCYVAVRSRMDDCTGLWEVKEYNTGCDFSPVSLPYDEEFNDYGTGSGTSPNCWYLKPYSASALTCISLSYYYPNYETGNTTSGGSLQMSASPDGYTYALLPAVEDIKNTQLDFQLYGYNWYGLAYVEIGVMESVDYTFKDQSVYVLDQATSDNLFTPMFYAEVTANSVWTNVVVDFSSYTGSGNRIALRTGKHTSTTSVLNAAVDHVSLYATPPCKVISSMNLDGIYTDYAEISWATLSDEELQWGIMVSTKEIDTDVEYGDVLNTSITEMPYTITELTENTTYYVYLRREYPGDDGCIGDWSEAFIFTTNCDPIGVNYVDNFEDNMYTGQGENANCWQVVGDVDVLPYPQTHSNSVTGLYPTDDNSVCYALENSTSSTDLKYVYAVLPEIDVDDIKEVQITFKAYTALETGGQFEIGVVTDPSSLTKLNDTYVSVYKDTIPTGEWTEFRVNFSNYTNDFMGGKGKYIAIAAMPGITDGGTPTSNLFYIDDVVVNEYTPDDCEVPFRLKAHNINDDNVTLSWYANEVSEYQVIVSTEPIDPTVNASLAIIDTIVTENPTVIRGLPVNTRLYAYVRSKCADNSYNDWSQYVTFHTIGCDYISLPFTDDFEYVTEPELLPNCWDFYDYVAGSNSEDVSISTDYPASGVASLKLPSGVLAVLPLADVENLVLTFDMYHYNLTYFAKAGVVRFVDETLTFIPLQELFPSATYVADSYEVRYCDYDEVQEGDQIAILSVAADNTTFYYTYIDNIYVDRYDALLTPSELTAGDITSTSFELNWNLSIDEVDEVQVAVMSAEQTLLNATIHSITSAPFNSITISNLDATTTYTVQVRARLGNSTTSWSNALSVTTGQIPGQIPFAEDFENADTNKQWLLQATSYATGIAATTYWTIGSSTAYEGDNSLYSTIDGTNYGYVTGISYAWAFRTVEITESGSYEVGVMAKCPTNSTSEFMTIAFLPASYSDINGVELTDPISGNTFTATATTGDYLVQGKIAQVTDWTEYNGRFVIDEPGLYNVVIYNGVYYTANVGVGAGAVDNISIDRYFASPVDLLASDITYNSALVTWGEVENATSYTVTLTSDNSSNTFDQLTSPAELVLTNLAASTEYTVSIVSNYGNDKSEPITLNFTTSPQPNTTYDYTNNFDNNTENLCWVVESDDENNWWVIGEDTYYNDNMSLYITNNSDADYAYGAGLTSSWVYREFEFDAPGMYNISMMAKCPSYDAEDYLSVSFIPSWFVINTSGETYENPAIGVVYDMSFTSSNENPYLIINKLYTSAEWTNYSRNIYVAEAGVYRIAALYYTNSSDYADALPAAIDNITVTEMTCSDPQNFYVEDLQASSAKISWVAGNSVTQYSVIISTTEITDFSSPEMYNAYTVNAAEVECTGLDASTKYYLYVKSDCDEATGYIEFTFTTQNDPYAIPYSEPFTDCTLNEVPAAWSVMSGDVYATDAVYHATSGQDVTLYMAANTLVVLPNISITNISDLEISLDAISSADNAQLTVGLISNVTDDLTFEPLATFDVSKYSNTFFAISDYINYRFDTYTGNATRIALLASADIYIDDVTVDNLSSCLFPTNLTTTLVSDYKAAVSWSNSGMNSRVVLSTADAYDIASIAAENIVLDTILVNGEQELTVATDALTSYYLFVASVCDDVTAESAKVAFTTKEESMHLPFYEPISVTSTTEFSALGWSNLSGTFSFNTAKISGDTLLSMATATSGRTTVSPYLEFPVLSDEYNVADLIVEFGAVASSTYSTVSIVLGVLETSGSTSTFVRLDTVIAPASSSSNFVLYPLRASFANYTGSSKHLCMTATSTVFIDDIYVYEASPCLAPSDLTISDIQAESALLSFASMKDQTEWRVVVTTNECTPAELDAMTPETAIFMQDVTITSNIELTNLQGRTDYFVYVRGIGNCDETPAWSASASFTTIMGKMTLPYYEPLAITNKSQLLSELGLNNIYGSFVPHSDVVVGDTVLNMYGIPYLQFPELDEPYNVRNLALSFEAISADKFSTPSVVVGVLEAPGIITTFVPVDTVVLSILNDPVVLEKFTVKFENYTGSSRYICITVPDYGDINIDDLYVYEITPCVAPDELTITNVTGSTANLSFHPVVDQDQWRVVVTDRVCTSSELNEMDASSAAFMQDVTKYANININNLEGSTDYYVYVRGIGNCDDTPQWSEYAMFTTLYAPQSLPYFEDFTTSDSNFLPDGWSRSNSNVDSLYFEYMTLTNYLYKEFATYEVANVESSPLLYTAMDGDAMDSVYRWAVGPEVIIDQSALCGFDLTLTPGAKYANPLSSYDVPSESEIRVYISTDFGKTWNQELVIGNNESDDYQMIDFFETTGRVAFDTDSYMGDTIKFAFYIHNEDAINIDVNIDNISINCVEERTYSDVISGGYDYQRNGFDIFYTKLTAGETLPFELYVPSPEKGICDSILTVNLTVLENVITNITGELCAEGDVYDAHGFTESYAGLYVNYDVAASGADSITYLTLTYREPNPITSINGYFCEGGAYNFGGEAISEAGIYRDTVADVNGCDSIIELTLSLTQGGEVEYEEATICEGGYYDLGGTQYTEPGVYTAEFVTDYGCEYTVELTLYVLDVDTTYAEETITLEDLPYEYRDTIFGEDTEVGVYTYEFALDNDTDCPDVEILTLTVIDGDVAVETTRILDLSIYPNPLASGATLYVDAEFTAAERDGMVIEVMNMVGQRIISAYPTTNDISINGLTQSGVYIVRITTGTGTQYLGKVIVK